MTVPPACQAMSQTPVPRYPFSDSEAILIREMNVYLHRLTPTLLRFHSERIAHVIQNARRQIEQNIRQLLPPNPLLISDPVASYRQGFPASITHPTPLRGGANRSPSPSSSSSSQSTSRSSQTRFNGYCAMLTNTPASSSVSNPSLSSRYQRFNPHYPFFLPDDPAQYPYKYGQEFPDLLPPCTAPTCEFCRDSTHLDTECPKRRYPVSPQELATYNGSHRTCRLCHLNGHGAFDCPWKNFGNNLILNQLKAMNGQPPSYPILPRPYTSDEINELQRRYPHQSFWITQDNVLVFKRAPAKATLVDSDIASLGGCKVPLSIVNDLRNQDRTFTNEQWYQQHLIYGCWKLTCPYVAVNYHPLINETDLDPHRPMCITILAAPCFNGQSPEEIRKWMNMYALRSSQESGLITAFTPASAIVKSLSRLTLLSTTIGSYPEWIPTSQTLIAFHNLFSEKRRLLKYHDFLPQFAGCNVFQREYYIDGKPLTGYKFHDLQAAIVRAKQQLSQPDPPTNVCMVVNRPLSQQLPQISSAIVRPEHLNLTTQRNPRLHSGSSNFRNPPVNGCMVSDKSCSQQKSQFSNAIARPNYSQSCTQRIPP